MEAVICFHIRSVLAHPTRVPPLLPSSRWFECACLPVLGLLCLSCPHRGLLACTSFRAHATARFRILPLSSTLSIFCPSFLTCSLRLFAVQIPPTVVSLLLPRFSFSRVVRRFVLSICTRIRLPSQRCHCFRCPRSNALMLPCACA